MTKSQKVWVKPELIILVRSKPEEAVLGACKGDGSLGAAGYVTNCAASMICTYCDANTIT
jgi:hypothetical protein